MRHSFLVLLTAAMLAAQSCAEESPAALVLDESAYCRAFYQYGIERISAKLLKTADAAVFDERAREALRRQVKSRFEQLGKKWEDPGWMDNAIVWFAGLQYGDRSRADTHIGTPPPPGNWMQTGFDDGAWLRQRQPVMVGTTLDMAEDRENMHGRRQGCFRYRFQVPDLAKAGDLAARLVYHGGARIFVNGQEVARGHLPEGELGADVSAEEYPAGAYALTEPDGSVKKHTNKRFLGRPMYVGVVPGSFDAAARVEPKKDGEELRWTSQTGKNKYALDRQAWERLQKVRDRVLSAPVPKKLLKQGENLLAIEIRESQLHPIAAGWNTFVLDYNESWLHAQMVKLELRASGPLPSALQRPAGIQVWAEDMHRRMISTEYGENSGQSGTLRFAGAANGTFSAQIVVSTDKDLAGLKATATELQGEGAKLPASALVISFQEPHTLDQLSKLGMGRGGAPQYTPLHGSDLPLARHGPPEAREKLLMREEKSKFAQQLSFFDHIRAEPIASVPANTCQPLWVALKVPPDAPPGIYRGTLTVEAQGMTPVKVPVEAEIAGWRLPDAKDFQTVVCLEQSPYGVAKQYNAPLWSDEHFKKMEGTFRQLARAGNDWLFVPVISYTEFGNLQDSPVRWIRRKDGSFDFDFKIVERYLDVAVKHLGRPRVICFVVSLGAAGNPAEVQIMNETTSQNEKLDLANNTPHYQTAWKAFGTALYGFMRAKGLQDSMYWGYGWDDLTDQELPLVLAGVAPDVLWAGGGHRPTPGHYFRANSLIYDFTFTEYSQMGWKYPDVRVYNPRGGGSVQGVSGMTLPFALRLLVDRSIISGLNGVGRMGADYWADVFLAGLKNEGYLRPGMPVHSLLWPGKDGADSGARFEGLLEGVQETEARIFLEQSLERKALPDDMAAAVKECLLQHNKETLQMPSLNESEKITETCTGWQARSRRLFAAAAKAAQVVGLDVDRYAVTAAIPARGKTVLELRLRSWTAQPREWKASADQSWIVPARPSGKASGHEHLSISLDGSSLKPGETVKGVLTITDAASGKAHAVAISASVSKVFDYVSATATMDRARIQFIPDDGKEALNLTPGETGQHAVTFFNKSAVELAWNASTSLPWLMVSPAAGRIAPGTHATVTLTGKPQAAHAGMHEAVLSIAETNGAAKEEIKLAVYALPKYAPPAAMPAGEAVLLDAALHASLVKSRKNWHVAWCGHDVHYIGKGKEPPMPASGLERGQKVENGLSIASASEVVYNIAGKGYTAFSTLVDLPQSVSYKYWTAGTGPPPDWVRLRFEIYVDGKLRADSDWIGWKDDARTLAVDGLKDAKELRLVARFQKWPPYAVTCGWWNPRFYK